MTHSARSSTCSSAHAETDTSLLHKSAKLFHDQFKVLMKISIGMMTLRYHVLFLSPPECIRRVFQKLRLPVTCKKTVEHTTMRKASMDSSSKVPMVMPHQFLTRRLSPNIVEGSIFINKSGIEWVHYILHCWEVTGPISMPLGS